MPVQKSRMWKPHEDDDLIEVFGSEGDWSLWRRARTDQNGWFGFALQPPEQLRKTKSVYYGAWNGERLARLRDMGHLAEHHLEIYIELEKACPSIEWNSAP